VQAVVAALAGEWGLGCRTMAGTPWEREGVGVSTTMGGGAPLEKVSLLYSLNGQGSQESCIQLYL